MRMIEGPTLIFSAQWAIGKATMLALGFWPGLFMPVTHRFGRPANSMHSILFKNSVSDLR